MTKQELFAAAIDADAAFSAGLLAHYGKEGPSDARYLPDSEMPSHILALKVAKIAADEAYFASYRLSSNGSAAPWVLV